MRFDKSLARTVLFSVAVVSFLIGVYQTILQNSVARNYEVFMLSFICVLLFRYLGLDDQKPTGTPPAATTAKTGKAPTGRATGKSNPKRRK